MLAVGRVAFLTSTGISSNRLFVRAAAMSYYSLVAMGPLIAIIVMVSGFVLRGHDRDFAADTLNRLVLFIAPPVAEYTRMADPTEGGGASVNDDLVELINNIIESAQSKSVGILGLAILAFIGIQLLTSIETTFNEIWGGRRGRSWSERIVFYWTFISLGSMVGFGALGLLTTSTFVGIFTDFLPFGEQIGRMLLLAAPVFSFAVMVGILAAFYVFFPNTPVRWGPALGGAFLVSVLLVLNNLFSIVYVQRVIENKSLYGSVGIIPVLMIGLYVFWFFVLLGAQLTYALQNAAYITNQEAWKNVSMTTRELLALAALTLICRRFHACQTPYSAPELGSAIRAPVNLVNECLSRLGDMGWVTTLKVGDEHPMETARYHPARPLEKMNLAQFRIAFEEQGNNDGAAIIEQSDPLVQWYHRVINPKANPDLQSHTMADVIRQTPC